MYITPKPKDMQNTALPIG